MCRSISRKVVCNQLVRDKAMSPHDRRFIARRTMPFWPGYRRRYCRVGTSASTNESRQLTMAMCESQARCPTRWLILASSFWAAKIDDQSSPSAPELSAQPCKLRCFFGCQTPKPRQSRSLEGFEPNKAKRRNKKESLASAKDSFVSLFQTPDVKRSEFRRNSATVTHTCRSTPACC